MSGWTFNINYKMETDLFDELIARVQNPSRVLDEAGRIAVEKIVQNIDTKDIIDTGNLRRSVAYEKQDENTIIISDNTDYGVYNEFGTSRMAARPFFVPAIDGMGDEIMRLFIEWIK